MITPKTCSSSWNTTFCIFFLSYRLSRSNRWYSECILMEGDTHAFCVIFFAAQSMASKPPAVTLFTVVNLRKSTRPQRPLAIGGARRKSPGGDVSSFRSVSQIMFGWIMMNDSRYTSIWNSNRFDWVMSFAKLLEVGWGCSHPNLPSNIYKYLIGIPNGLHCRPILFPTSSRFSATVPPRESLA